MFKRSRFAAFTLCALILSGLPTTFVASAQEQQAPRTSGQATSQSGQTSPQSAKPSSTTGQAAEESKYWLGRNIVPEFYDITLDPDLEKARFTGEVSIDVRVTKPTAEIVLNAVQLTIDQATVTDASGTSFNGTVTLEPQTERARIRVSGTVGSGTAKIKLRYAGVLNDKLKGFYLSTYKDDKGVVHKIATTQFEPTDFRWAVPSFDQPDMKAAMRVTIKAPGKMVAISNGRVVRTTLDQATGKKIVEFAPTIPIPTYIAAFVVGDLVSTNPVFVDGVEVRVWTVPGKEHLAKMALDTAQFALHYYKDYFGVPYPGEKLDLLAIPDFSAGAMENLGAITFRESALLLDLATSSQISREWVAEVVAHEIAHMWFGDLVTMRNWDVLWLNEAFATFQSNKCVDAWQPTWGIWDRFGLSRAAAFRTDALRSTRPIEFVVHSPDEANAMFDVITYKKGSSVLRMLEQYLGESTFRQAISVYIRRHQYGNAVSADLWKALEEVSGQPVGQIMESWIKKPGYPIVSVDLANTNGSIVLRQQNFKFLPDAVDKSALWSVPVMLRAKTAAGIVERKVLLSSKEMTVNVGEGLDWVVVNASGHGFYRVVYGRELQGRLARNLHDLSVIERLNLVSDTWASVQAGQADPMQFVELVQLFRDETNPNIWSVITSGLASLKRLLPKDHRPAFEEMVRTLVRPAFTQMNVGPAGVKFPKADELHAQLFETLVVTAGDTAVRQQARQLYANWRANQSSLDGNMVDAVLYVLATDGNEDFYNEIYRLYKSAKNPEERDRFLSTLGYFRDAKLAKRTLQYALQPDEIRTQDAGSVVGQILSSETAGPMAWQFVKDNWVTMNRLYPSNLMSRMCSRLTSHDTPAMEADISAWLGQHKIAGAEKSMDQTLELLHVAVLQRQRANAPLTAAFPAGGNGAAAH